MPTNKLNRDLTQNDGNNKEESTMVFYIRWRDDSKFARAARTFSVQKVQRTHRKEGGKTWNAGEQAETRRARS